MHVHHPHLAAVGARVAVAEIDASFADRFDLGAEQRDTRLLGFEDVVVVARFAIVGDDSLCFLALVLLHHGSTTILDAMTASWRPRRRM